MADPGSPETDPDFEKARKRRNLTIAWSLVAFVVIVFLVSIAKMKMGG
jgi:hypothetical protein